MADRVAVMHEGEVLQVASPVELYERPVSHFVADFIGEMNFLEGTGSGDRFEVPGVGIFAVAGGVGSARFLGIRPEKLAIGDESSTNQITGSVIDVSFYGALTHCVIEVPGLDQPLRANVTGPLQLPVGAAVTVGWEPADAVALDH